MEQLSSKPEFLINPELEAKPKFDLIWTVDKICAWDCDFCCVDAFCVKRKGDLINIGSNGFNTSFPYDTGGGSIL